MFSPAGLSKFRSISSSSFSGHCSDGKKPVAKNTTLTKSEDDTKVGAHNQEDPPPERRTISFS